MRTLNNLEYLSNSLKINKDSVSVRIEEDSENIDLTILGDLGEITNISYQDYQLSIAFRDKILSIYINNKEDIGKLAKTLNKMFRGRQVLELFIKYNGDKITTGIELDMETMGTTTLHFRDDSIAHIEITNLQ